MNGRVMRAAILTALGTLATGREARAGVRDVCLSSYEHAQLSRHEGKLLRARAELLLCAQSSCPEATKADCVPWLDEVEKAIPTIVLAAKDGGGHEVVGARASLDGAALLAGLDGRAVAVDPGEHVLVFSLPDGREVVQKVSAREGEKDRVIVAELPLPRQPSPPPPLPGDGRAEPGRAGPSTAVYVLGGLGVLALGSFAYFGLDGMNDSNTLHSSCFPHCDSAAVSSARRELLVADLSLGVSLVSLGAAAVLFVTGTRHAASKGAVNVGVLPVAGGAVGSFAWVLR